MSPNTSVLRYIFMFSCLLATPLDCFVAMALAVSANQIMYVLPIIIHQHGVALDALQSSYLKPEGWHSWHGSWLQGCDPPLVLLCREQHSP